MLKPVPTESVDPQPDFEIYALVNLMLLRNGETLASPRVLEEVGSSIMVNIHFIYDRYRETGTAPPEYVGQIWDEYLDFRLKRDASRSFTEAHHSHYGHLGPGRSALRYTGYHSHLLYRGTRRRDHRTVDRFGITRAKRDQLHRTSRTPVRDVR